MCIAPLTAAAPSQTQVGRSPDATTQTTAIGTQIATPSVAYSQMNNSRSSVTPFAARFHSACSTAAHSTSASASPPTPAGCHTHRFVSGLRVLAAYRLLTNRCGQRKAPVA